MESFDSLFFGEVNESDLRRAIRNNDEDYLETYLKQYDKEKDNDLFLVLNKITVERDLNFDVSKVKYNKYIIDDMLSRNANCLGSVFITNIIGDGLTNQQHYDYLVRTIPVGRKSYKDNTKRYLDANAYEMMVKILLCMVYMCRMEVAKDYYDVLVSRNKVDEFVQQFKTKLSTVECELLVKRYIKNNDVRKEFNNIVDDLLG